MPDENNHEIPVADSMHMDWILLGIPAGIVLLYFGSDMLVDGAKNVALKLGITPFVIGLTVLAFGSSAPEAITSIVSRDSPGLIIGNVVGSNIVNIAVCIGLAAIICPMCCSFRSNRVEYVTMLLSALLVLAFAIGSIVFFEGLALFLLLLVFLLVVYRTKRGSPAEGDSMEACDAPMWKCVATISLGLVMLYFGSEWFVEGSKEVAEMMGVPELVIGLFLVAIGTSLPELCISVMAAIRHENDLAVSNIVGSNIFNAFFVLGIGSMLTDIPAFDSLFTLHLPVMILLTVLMVLFAWRCDRITRPQGAVLLGIYFAYALVIICMPELSM